MFLGFLEKRVFDRVDIYISECSQRKILPKLNYGLLQLVVKMLSYFIVSLCTANLILLSRWESYQNVRETADWPRIVDPK
jgi:hypothetical protein